LGDVDTLFATQQQHEDLQQEEQGHQQLRISPHGTFTRFTYDEQHQLTMQAGPCECHSQHVSAMNAAAAAINEGQQQQPAVVQLDLPDWTYSRLPADVGLLTTAAAAAGGCAGSSSSNAAVVFEVGTALSNGSLARWLLQYDAAGDRLLKSATYELYPAA
jgi:YD repeat-containing protein